jgi:hypothetical protein
VPLPSQAPTGVSVDPLQVARPQLVPLAASAQAPLPLQVPLGPHTPSEVAAQPPCGSTFPAATGWQEPALPVRLQTWQLPQLGAEQQTPSTQLPLPHSVPAAQSWPRRLSPHAPALQTFPGAQSLLPAQTATQAVPVAALHANGEQDCVAAVLQVPLPSHARASVAVTELLGQEALAHCVPAL